MTALKKATSLDEVISVFNPKGILSSPEELASFYVDREKGTVRRTIKKLLTVNVINDNVPTKFLFTGHRGSGKSTEINKLCEELDGQFFIVHVSFRDRPSVTYVDVILKAALALFKQATNEAIIKKAPAQITSGLFEDAYSFLNKLMYGEHNIPNTKNTKKLTLTATLHSFLGEIEGKFETEPQSRQEISNKTEKLLSELTSKINLLVEEIKIRYQRPVLFIFNDMDKIDLADTRKIFYDHTDTLTQMRVSAIYVIDIALRYTPEFQNVLQGFDEFCCLPNIKLFTRNGERIDDNFALLSKVITQRADKSLFTDEAIEALIKASGGLMRYLIVLVRNAALRADDCIEKEHVQHAINRAKGDFISMIKSEHYKVLEERHLDKNLSADDDIQYLLQALALLEYENGTYWCDVHPIILDEVKERNKNRLEQENQ